MGTTHTLPIKDAHNLRLMDIHYLTEWDVVGKNFKYYNGERFFKISRKHYPQYTRGYLYGYYEDPEYFLFNEGEKTHSF